MIESRKSSPIIGFLSTKKLNGNVNESYNSFFKRHPNFDQCVAQNVQKCDDYMEIIPSCQLQDDNPQVIIINAELELPIKNRLTLR